MWTTERRRQRKRWIDVVKYNMEDLQVDLMDVERIEPSGDGEPVWLTPHPRDLNQPEGERVVVIAIVVVKYKSKSN